MNSQLSAAIQGGVDLFKSMHDPLWQLEGVSRENLLLPDDVPKKRFVFISDTHSKHDELSGLPVLPDGDVLVHGGDAIPNLGGDDEYLIGCYRDFLEWISQQSCRYEYIVLIGGNHDTILDWQKYPHFRNRIKPYLDRLPANVTYLHYRKPMITIDGIRIYGSPTCVCRVELQNRNMVSNAFERPIIWRQKEWNDMPISEIDILITHIPPEEVLSAPKRGCSLLSERIACRDNNSIKFHLFGHEHDYNGIVRSVHDNETDNGIVFINGAQPVRFHIDRSGQRPRKPPTTELLHQMGVQVFDYDMSLVCEK